MSNQPLIRPGHGNVEKNAQLPSNHLKGLSVQLGKLNLVVDNYRQRVGVGKDISW